MSTKDDMRAEEKAFLALAEELEPPERSYDQQDEWSKTNDKMSGSKGRKAIRIKRLRNKSNGLGWLYPNRPIQETMLVPCSAQRRNGTAGMVLMQTVIRII